MRPERSQSDVRVYQKILDFFMEYALEDIGGDAHYQTACRKSLRELFKVEEMYEHVLEERTLEEIKQEIYTHAVAYLDGYEAGVKQGRKKR